MHLLDHDGALADRRGHPHGRALAHVADGGSALDPDVVGALLAPTRGDDELAALSAREREVLALVAEGRTNAGIAKHLWLTEKTVETHVSSILAKLNLERRAQAAAYMAKLRGSGGDSGS